MNRSSEHCEHKMSDPILEELTSQLAPVAKALAAQFAPKITEHPTYQVFREVVQTLAEKDGLSISSFLSSGRAIEVLRSLAMGNGVPDKPDIQIIRCTECGHVMYN